MRKKTVHWSKEEKDFIKANDTSMTIPEMCKKLGRSKGSIDKLRKQLGLKKNLFRPWTEEEIQIIRDNPKMTSSEIGKLLGRSHGSVSGKRSLIKEQLIRTCVTCGNTFTSKWSVTKVCGECDSSENYNPVGILRRYGHYKDGARKRGMVFDISHSTFYTFWKKPCTYCGNEIETVGLDRIKSDIGYIDGNIISCCSRCNEMKMSSSYEEWIEHMKKILKHLGEL